MNHASELDIKKFMGCKSDEDKIKLIFTLRDQVENQRGPQRLRKISDTKTDYSQHEETPDKIERSKSDFQLSPPSLPPKFKSKSGKQIS
jgi:hypothetical protein